MASTRCYLSRFCSTASSHLLAIRAQPPTCLMRAAMGRCLRTSTSSGMKFTKDHEWVKEEQGIGRVGVTNYAQEQLGEVVYVELPEVEREVEQGIAVGALESVKAASDLLTPVSGVIVAVNEALESNPDLINSSPHEDGWIYDIKLTQLEELTSLMNAEEYDKFLKEHSQE